MKNSEFSETQFVLGYTRELFNSLGHPFIISSPSTRTEKQQASDLIIKIYNRSGNYRYSEFYQFKRSKYYNKEVFDSLKGSITIDTATSPKYGFKIYNKRESRQFNVLKRLAVKPKCRVYYCAPLFHTLNEFNRYFSASSILNNSKVFPVLADEFQKIRIPLDSNHSILFDRATQHICSDPIEIQGYLASERSSFFSNISTNTSFTFEETVAEVHKTVTSEIIESQMYDNFEPPPINFLEVREMLITYFDVYWLLNNNIII